MQLPRIVYVYHVVLGQQELNAGLEMTVYKIRMSEMKHVAGVFVLVNQFARLRLIACVI
jgi:hypothetical protein